MDFDQSYECKEQKTLRRDSIISSISKERIPGWMVLLDIDWLTINVGLGKFGIWEEKMNGKSPDRSQRNALRLINKALSSSPDMNGYYQCNWENYNGSYTLKSFKYDGLHLIQFPGSEVSKNVMLDNIEITTEELFLNRMTHQTPITTMHPFIERVQLSLF